MQNNNIPKKQQQLIDTARELFCRHGVRRVTVEEICHRAQVSKMTFYKHFSNKLALVRYIRDLYVEEGFRKFDEIKALDIPFDLFRGNTVPCGNIDHAYIGVS